MNISYFKKCLLIPGLISATLAWGCKAKHSDSEPTFSLTFFPKAHQQKFHSCINISGLNGKLYMPQQCVDSATTLNVPCNILSDTSVFVFQYDTTRFDTLALTYNYGINPVQSDDNSYFYMLSKVNIVHCTFDSIKVMCNDNTKPCDDIKSINIYM